MKSLTYLIFTGLKNQIKALPKKPGKLILYLLLLLFIGFSIFSTSSTDFPAMDPIDIGWLKLFFLGYLALFFAISISTGLSTGQTLFTMADANLLFTCPISPKTILIYGILQQSGRSMASGVFVLMMGANLKMFFGISTGGMFLLFLFYAIGILLTQLLSVAIYMFANGNTLAKRIVIGVVILCLLPALFAIAIPVLQNHNPMAIILEAINGNILFLIPLVGWITLCAFSILSGAWVTALLSFGLCVLSVALILAYLLRGKADYYEDVLVATEINFQRQEAIKSGDINATTGTTKTKKIGKIQETTFNGNGPSVFFSRHILEDKRANTFFIISPTFLTLLFVAGFQSFVQGADGSIFTPLFTCLLMRLFLIGTSKGLRELYLPYIYLMPASPFSKLMWSNAEAILINFLENIIIFGISVFFLKGSILLWILCVLVSTAFSIMLISTNLLSMRIFRDVISQGILMIFYVFFVAIVSLPGIIGGVLSTIFLYSTGLSLPIGFGICSLWFLLLSALFIFLSRGILHNCDMETMPKSTR